MTVDAIVVFVTVPGVEQGRAIADDLVRNRLAACVNIVPGVESVYRWEGAIETSAEAILIVKTAMRLYPDVERRIRSLHEYTTPEIIALSVARGLPEYLAWIAESTTPAEAP